jgi:hypothetical protein
VLHDFNSYFGHRRIRGDGPGDSCDVTGVHRLVAHDRVLFKSRALIKLGDILDSNILLVVNCMIYA